jgi:rod shape-determining protein MreD
MRMTSYSLLDSIPGLFGLVLMAFFATPMEAGGWPLSPNVGLIMTVLIVTFYPETWPRWFAFFFGLLQDVIFGTPLGSQALLLLLLVAFVEQRRGTNPAFPMRMAEAVLIFLGWHMVLWLVGNMAQPGFASLMRLMQAAITSALWFPVFYFFARRAS